MVLIHERLDLALPFHVSIVEVLVIKQRLANGKEYDFGNSKKDNPKPVVVGTSRISMPIGEASEDHFRSSFRSGPR